MLDSPEYNFLTPELKQIVFRKLLVKSQDLRPLTLQLLDQYHRKANPLALENLRQLRLQVAGKWLNASVDTLESLYQSSLKEVHQMLIQSSLQVELLTGSERQLVNQLTQRLNQGIHTSHHLKALLAVMLYQPACQINLNYQNAIIPGYFFQDFLNYLWDSSPWIIGSNLQQWIQFNRGLLKYLHTNLELAHCTDSHLDFWHHVVAVFTKVSNTPAWNSDNYSAKKSQELLQDLFNDRAQFLQLNT
ncbi:MAG: hypothetical protein HC825_11910 [Oscillatoriales cyanobacterium RM1_1_9]|nr:hypothetical protein [Oscillatoriales cyanobacterium RM1_1_9]